MSHPLIVIVDDSHTDVYMLSQSIQDQAQDVKLHLISDGEAAMQFVLTQESISRERHPCVILLDLHLPKVHGLEVLRSIRGKPALDHIHVVVLTGAASPSEEAELRRMGTGSRPKPFSLSEFEALAAELIELCKTASHASV
ncbi:MAG: response regulator [Bryobacteraceae bacterium]